VRQLLQAGVDAVAVCYLHAYRDPSHELATRQYVETRLPAAYISLSSEVLPQIKEYERVCTTVVNAYVGPTLSRYLTHLAARLQAAGYRGDVLIMQSHGGVAPLADAARLAAGAILSGPAGGIAGSRYCARLLGEDQLISFDMGGTSTDISVIEAGEPFLTGDKSVGGLKVALPSLDIHTLGAGGGSTAYVDLGGILHVGPESAGADPGPACYGKGGTAATVTDANVVLGYLHPGNFLGGRTPLDTGAALAAVEKIAQQLGITPVAAAAGVHHVVNTTMAEGIRIVSARRGVDPRRFALLGFGGAAGLHITAVARLLEITRVVIPRLAAVLSAWGMLATDLRYELVRTHVGEVQQLGSAALHRLFTDMEADGRAHLATAFAGPVSVRRAADMRYGEQIFEITVPLDGIEVDAPDLIERVIERFHRRHEALYTYSAPDQEVVLVNVRLAVVGELPMLPAEPVIEASEAVALQGSRRVYLGTWVEVPVYPLDALSPGATIDGPAVVESATTTVLIRNGDHALVTPHGWLDIRIA
jgi:N-methylhydantoinase A